MRDSAEPVPSGPAEAMGAMNEGWAEGECAYFLEPSEDDLALPSSATALQLAEDHEVSARTAAPRLLYLNPEGGVYSPGLTNHSGRDRSSLISIDVDIPPFPGGEQAWTELEACVERRFSRFGLMLTTKDPGETPHIEAVIGGHPCQLALPDRVRGVSPLADDCSVLERAVVFVFAETIASSQVLCDVTVHEVGHALGLEHAYLCDDMMSYLRCGQRSFQDEEAPCGTRSLEECVCQESQNSVAHLYEALGVKSGADVERPSVKWRATDLFNGPAVEGVFEVAVEVDDDGEIDVVKLIVEGDTLRLFECRGTTDEEVCTQPTPGVYVFRFPLAPHDRSIRAQAIDVSGNKGMSSTRTVPFAADSLLSEK